MHKLFRMLHSSEHSEMHNINNYSWRHECRPQYPFRNIEYENISSEIFSIQEIPQIYSILTIIKSKCFVTIAWKSYWTQGDETWYTNSWDPGNSNRLFRIPEFPKDQKLRGKNLKIRHGRNIKQINL